jgi:hypothetical protein
MLNSKILDQKRVLTFKIDKIEDRETIQDYLYGSEEEE